MAVAAIATVIALSTGPFSIRIVSLLAGLENHLRIFSVFLIGVAAAISRRNTVNLVLIWKILFFAAALLAIFGVMQVLYQAQVRDISLNLYAGRHDRVRSTVDLCLGVRAVSTFYSPGNLGMFLAMICVFAFLAKGRFKIPRYPFLIGLFIIVFGGIQSISKVFLGVFFVLILYLLLRKKWRKALLGIFFFSLAFFITGFFNYYAYNCYRTTIRSICNPITAYNEILGSRFGKINVGVVKGGQVDETEDDVILVFLDEYFRKGINRIVDFINFKMLSSDQKEALLQARISSLPEDQKKALIQAQVASLPEDQKKALIQAQVASLPEDQKKALIQAQVASLPEDQKEALLQARISSLPEDQKKALIQAQVASLPEDQKEALLSVNISSFSEGRMKTVDEFILLKEKGYLTEAVDVLKKWPIIGVGYVSNVSSGDSMFLHCMIRGGIVGSIFFLIFLILVIRQVILRGKGDDSETKALREAWVFVAVIFLVGGVGFPTFIQDRTGDVFWLTGALLCFSRSDTSQGEKFLAC